MQDDGDLKKHMKVEGFIFAPYIPLPSKIPEIDLELTTTEAKATSRKLCTKWSLESADDFIRDVVERLFKIETEADLENMRFMISKFDLKFAIDGRWVVYQDPSGDAVPPALHTPDSIKIGDTVRVFGKIPSVVDILATLDESEKGGEQGGDRHSPW